MSIVGFNFTKILVEKKTNVKGKVSISNNVAIKDVKNVDLADIPNQDGIKFFFQFTSSYAPGVGKIEIEGDVMSLEKPDTVKKILETWQKEKKVSAEVMEDVLNTIFTRCNIQALILSRDINLPPPVQLPKITKQEKSASVAATKPAVKKKVAKKK